ncbi:hypothetical protein [Paenibacillus chitinolyticus]|uniref:hypothetical protein n=1 Tax=Paenibacillus chitinolyticus TaxID=79263 RepID=UPI00366D0D9F
MKKPVDTGIVPSQLDLAWLGRNGWTTGCRKITSRRFENLARVQVPVPTADKRR